MNQFVELVTRELRGRAAELPRQLDPRHRTERRLARCVNVEDVRRVAHRSVPSVVFDFVEGGANDELTLAANRSDFQDLRLLPRALVDVDRIDPSATVLGSPVALPLLGAPTGLTGLVHHEGEVGIARAVHAAGSVYVLSAMASYSMEEVRAATDGPLWFQSYVWRDRGFVRSMIERAQAIGALALVITVDVPVAGARERDRRNGFGIPPRLTRRSLMQGVTRPRWSRDFIRRPRISVANAAGADVRSDAASLVEYINSQFNAALSWADLAWVREHWDGPLIIKGLLRPQDVRQAVEEGADAIIVSNHGGRQLDGALSAISALPAVVDAVEGQAEVYLDGGIRRGSDVLKALALGAHGCLAGRALVYGVGAGGEAGARRVLTILAEELRLAMALSGCPDVTSIDRELICRGTTTTRRVDIG